jgi:hypothetical protein
MGIQVSVESAETYNHVNPNQMAFAFSITVVYA